MNDITYTTFIIFGYGLLCIAGVGLVFMVDALLFGFTGRSFVGLLDKFIK